MNPTFYATWAPRALALLRITTAYMFLLHGTAKLFGMPHVPMFDKLQIMSLSGVAGILEVVGGVLLILGLFTRPTAFILSGEMAFGYFLGHAIPQGWVLAPMMNRGESAALFCFIFLYIAAAGPGAWSLDGLRRHNRPS
jgi:putative oxidoreductase